MEASKAEGANPEAGQKNKALSPNPTAVFGMTLAVICIAIAWRTGFVAGASLERAKSNACYSRGSLLSCDGRCGLADVLDRLRVQLPAQHGRRIGKRRMTVAERSCDNVAGCANINSARASRAKFSSNNRAERFSKQQNST